MIRFALALALSFSPNQSLIEACLSGNVAKLKTAVEQGAELELRHGNNDLTPLMLSVYRDHPEQMQYLIESGANINARSADGFTPLLMAASGGQIELCRVLLKNKADLNAHDEQGNTALHWAAYWNHIPVLKLLLAAGLDPNLRNLQGNTALLLAASANSGKSGPPRKETQSISPAGRKANQQARSGTIPAVLKLLLNNHADANLSNQQGETPLMLLSAEGNRSAVLFLLASGAQAELQNTEGLKASDYARNKGFNSLASELEIFAKNP